MNFGSEEPMRYQKWLANKEFVKKHNSGNSTFTVGLNQFAHMDLAEFRSKYLMPKTSVRISRAQQFECQKSFKDNGDKPPSSCTYTTTDNPAGQVQVTKVKNQGQCGSCWTFGAAAAMEAEVCRQGNKNCTTWSGLATQQLVDCASLTTWQTNNSPPVPTVIDLSPYDDHGCEGGFQSNAMRYIWTVGSFVEWDDWVYISGYTEHMQQCALETYESDAMPASKIVSKCGITTSGDETELKKAVAQIGAMTISIDANHNEFQLYESGLYANPECSSTELDHAVTLTGYGTGGNGIAYWEVKNSWAETWGMNGYVHMIRNDDNNCGVATDAQYAIN